MITDFSSKIVAFRFTAPSSVTIMIDGIGQFHNNQFDVNELPFNPFSFLHYEPVSNVYQVADEHGKIGPMTESQIVQIQNYIKTVPELLNISMSCYDPNKHNLYMGMLPISEAKEKGYISVMESCDFAVGRYNTTTNSWEKIKAIVTGEGHVLIDPDGYCEQCVLFLSEEEWLEFPKPEGFSKSADVRYDLETNQWVDVRSIKDSIRFYKDYVKNILTQIEMDKYYEKGLDKTLILSVETTIEEYAPEFTEELSNSIISSTNSTVTHEDMVHHFVNTRKDINQTVIELRNYSKMIFNLMIAFTSIPDIIVDDPLKLTQDMLDHLNDHFEAFIKSQFDPKYIVD